MTVVSAKLTLNIQCLSLLSAPPDLVVAGEIPLRTLEDFCPPNGSMWAREEDFLVQILASPLVLCMPLLTFLNVFGPWSI